MTCRLKNNDGSDQIIVTNQAACEALCNDNDKCTGYGFGKLKKVKLCYQLTGDPNEIVDKLVTKRKAQRNFIIRFKVWATQGLRIPCPVSPLPVSLCSPSTSLSILRCGSRCASLYFFSSMCVFAKQPIRYGAAAP